MPKVTSDPAVLDLADRLGATPAQVGLAWLLAHRDNILLIPGTSSVAHLEENVKAGDLVLSADRSRPAHAQMTCTAGASA